MSVLWIVITFLILVTGASIVAWYLKRPRRSPQVNTSAGVTIPPPTGGYNLIDGPSSMAPNDAAYIRDLIPSTGGGLNVRYGTKEHATNVGTGNVLTLVSFSGGLSAQSKLFASSSAGIYDVTASGSAAFKQKIAFGTTSGVAGLGVGIGFTTIGDSFCLWCDEENGYYVYANSTGTFSKIASGTGAAQLSGVDPASCVFVTAWKNRVWLVEKDTANGWYLPVGQVYGVATKFNFGSRFTKGGSLVGLWSWTIDGGRGVDDYLVAVSSAGELLIFEGTDPDTVDAFNLVGTWDLGAVFGGRRCAYNYNGDLLVITRSGLVSVSQIRRGMGLDVATQITRKIQPLIESVWTASALAFCVEHPNDRALMFVVSSTVVAMSKSTFGWFPYLYIGGAPSFGIRSAVEHEGVLYLGLASGKVHSSVPGYDDQDSAGANGTAQQWRWCSAPIGRDFLSYKSMVSVLARFSSGPETFGVGSRHVFANGSSSVGAVAETGGTANVWSGVSPIDGSSGMSREIQLVMAGVGSATLGGVEVLLEPGGVT